MGVDAKWWRFPICPEMSRFVPVCSLLSRLVAVPGPQKDKRGQAGTKRDISTNWEKPPFRIFFGHKSLVYCLFPALKNLGGIHAWGSGIGIGGGKLLFLLNSGHFSLETKTNVGFLEIL